MKKQVLTSLALGSAVAFTSMSASAAGVDNPFSMAKLSQGYQVAEADAKTMEGKCGADKAGEKMMDGKCGGDKADHADMKKKDGQCGGDKADGGAMKKKDGKCGEGKCGSGKK